MSNTQCDQCAQIVLANRRVHNTQNSRSREREAKHQHTIGRTDAQTHHTDIERQKETEAHRCGHGDIKKERKMRLARSEFIITCVFVCMSVCVFAIGAREVRSGGVGGRRSGVCSLRVSVRSHHTKKPPVTAASGPSPFPPQHSTMINMVTTTLTSS